MHNNSLDTLLDHALIHQFLSWSHRPFTSDIQSEHISAHLTVIIIRVNFKIYQICLAASHPRSTLRNLQFSTSYQISILSFIATVQCSVWYPIPCLLTHNFQCNIQQPCCAHSHYKLNQI